MAQPSSSTLAVLCTDLVGSTALLSAIGDRAFDDFRREHLATLRIVLQAFAGEEIKILGDGILAVFDAAANALDCAVAMQRAVDRPGPPDEVAIRVGVALGDVTREDGNVFGTAVVQAVLLNEVAGARQILTAAVVPLVAGGRTSATCRPIGPMTLEGLPEPLQVLEVLWDAQPASAPGMSPRVGVLGPVGVLTDGRCTELKGELQRRLLAMFVAGKGRVVSADELAEGLWGETAPAEVPAALQAQVFRLRKALQCTPARVETHGKGYRLVAATDQVDAWQFEALHEAAKTSDNPPRRLELTEHALSLWRGRAYLDAGDALALKPEADRLAELRAEVAELHAEATLHHGDPARAAADMLALIEEHPYRDRPVELAMRALTQAGRRPEALAVLRAHRSRPRNDLGLSAAPNLDALERDVLREEVPERPALTVGLPGNSFLGRDADQAAVQTLLSTNRLVTLTGPGGVGKTRLSLQTSSRLAAYYPDGVYLCELAKITEEDQVAEALDATLRLAPQAGRSPTERALDYLRPARALLIIDNCEHVIWAAADLVAAVLLAAPEVTVLATSRQRLGVQGEARFAVEPLPAPEGSDVDAPAVRLFVDRAAAVSHGWTLTAEVADTVAQLCRELEGLPLAIELAAARMVSRSPVEILADVRDALGRLTDQRRHEGRHRSMEAVVAWSYDLLESDQREVFERLSVFAGGFTAQAVADVVGTSVGEVHFVLDALTDHSLISRIPTSGPTRFGMLEPLRQYALARLAEHGALEETRARHAEWVTSWVVEAVAGMDSPDQASWLTRYQNERSNVLSGHRWLLYEGRADEAIRIAAAMYTAVNAVTLSDEFTLIDETVARFADTAPDHVDLPRAMATAAVGTWVRGDLAGARVMAERSIAAAQRTAPLRARWGWRALNSIEVISGNPERGIECTEHTLALAHEADDQSLLGYARTDLALARGYAGEVERACAEARAALDALTPDRSRTAFAFAHYTLGELLSESAPAEAMPHLERGRDLARDAGQRFFAGIAGLSLLSCALRLGLEVTLDAIGDLVDEWHRLGLWPQQWITIRTLVVMLTQANSEEAAAVLLGAVTGQAEAPPLVGPDAVRLGLIAEELRNRLSPARFADLAGQGAAMTRDHVASFALRVTRSHQVPAGESPNASS